MSHLIRQVPVQLLRAEFSDVEQMCEAVRSWDLDFQPLAAPQSPGRIGAITQQLWGPCEITHARFSASIEQKGAPPSGAYTFVVLEAHMRRLWWRGRDVDSDTVLVFPLGSELHSFSGPDFEVFTVSVGEETIAGVCERFGLVLPPAHRRAETFHPLPSQVSRLRRQLRRLSDPDGSDGYLRAQYLVDELVLAWLDPATERARRRPSLRSRDRAMRRCLQQIEQAGWAELSSTLLCEVGGVGERTLQYAFRERFGLTPAAFLKAHRLAAVRQRLLQAQEGETKVGDVSAALGFWHAGHFATDYRRAFGEAPSATLKRSRRT